MLQRFFKHPEPRINADAKIPDELIRKIMLQSIKSPEDAARWSQVCKTTRNFLYHFKSSEDQLNYIEECKKHRSNLKLEAQIAAKYVAKAVGLFLILELTLFSAHRGGVAFTNMVLRLIDVCYDSLFESLDSFLINSLLYYAGSSLAAIPASTVGIGYKEFVVGNSFVLNRNTTEFKHFKHVIEDRVLERYLNDEKPDTETTFRKIFK